MMAVDESQL